MNKAEPVVVVPQLEGLEEDQLQFEGLDVGGFRFQLKGTSDLKAKEDHAIGDLLSGTWEGRVAGVVFERDKKTRVLLRKHLVEVTEARIETDTEG